MKDKKSVVVLYPEGRRDLPAKALEEYFSLAHRDVDLVAVPDTRYCARPLARLRLNFYVFTMRNMSRLYTAFSKIKSKTFRVKAAETPKKYENIKIEGAAQPEITPEKATENAAEKEKKPSKAGYTKRMRHVLIRYEPKVVVCLDGRALRLALRARREIGAECEIWAYNADFAYEKVLLQNGADGFIVADETAKGVAAGKGVPAEKIEVLGIALPRESFRKYEPDEIKEKLGIKSGKPVVTLAGGRYGRDSIKKQYDALLSRNGDFDLVAVTGGSRALEKYFNMAARAKGADGVYIVKETDSFSKLLSVTDVLVTSPTSAVCYEAFFRGIPCVLSKWSGMVEKGNAQYMLANNLALDGTEDEILDSALNSLENDAKLLETMTQAMTAAKSDAVVRLGDFLYSKLFSEEENA